MNITQSVVLGLPNQSSLIYLVIKNNISFMEIKNLIRTYLNKYPKLKEHILLM